MEPLTTLFAALVLTDPPPFDNVAPAAPSLKFSPASDTGVSPADRVTAQARPEFDGTAEPDSLVQVLVVTAAGQLVRSLSQRTDGAGISTSLGRQPCSGRRGV